jgi:replicative DNA helicase
MQPDAERPVPYDVRAEEAVLGSLLLDRDAIIHAVPFLAAADFYLEKNGWIYQAVVDLYQRREPADLVTLSAELERRQKLAPVGGLAYLASLMHTVPHAVHVEYYGRLVERCAVFRRLMSVGRQLIDLGWETDQELPVVLGRADQLVRSVTDRTGDTGFVALDAPRLSKHLDNLEDRTRTPQAKGIPTGIAALDYVLRWRKGQFIVPAARPSQGKTALALTFALAAQRAGYSVGIASLEMDTDEICDRLLAMEGGISLHSLRMADIDAGGWQALFTGAQTLTDRAHPLHVLEAGTITVPQLRGLALQLQARAGLDLLIVDYIQLIRPVRETANRVRDVGDITRGLKQTAREMRVPVIAPSQLSRAIETRANKEPELSDLRESGSIENDADVVMFIHRPVPDIPEDAELHIRKHRNGPIGQVPVYWHAQQVRFYGRDDESE